MPADAPVGVHETGCVAGAQSFTADLKRLSKEHAKMQCYGLGLGLDTFRMVALMENFRKLEPTTLLSACSRWALIAAAPPCCCHLPAGSGDSLGLGLGVLSGQIARSWPARPRQMTCGQLPIDISMRADRRPVWCAGRPGACSCWTTTARSQPTRQACTTRGRTRGRARISWACCAASARTAATRSTSSPGAGVRSSGTGSPPWSVASLSGPQLAALAASRHVQSCAWWVSCMHACGLASFAGH